MNDDPVAALVKKWERQSEIYADGDFKRRVLNDAAELREALKLRPRGSAEQIEEIERLKSALQFEKNAYAGAVKDLGRSIEQMTKDATEIQRLKDELAACNSARDELEREA